MDRTSVEQACRYRNGAVGFIIAIFAAVVLAGCAAAPEDRRAPVRIDYGSRPADWPELHVDSHNVPASTLASVCASLHRPGVAVLACAMPYFCARRCTIWYGDHRLSKGAITHEEAHCRGYDHVGSSQLRQMWDQAKQRGCGPDMPVVAKP